MGAFFVTSFVVENGLPNGMVFDSPTSPTYVFNPTVEALAGVVVGIFVVTPFVMLFDIVSDTVLYCYQLEALWEAAARESLAGSMRPGTLADSLRSKLSCPCGWRVKEDPEGISSMQDFSLQESIANHRGGIEQPSEHLQPDGSGGRDHGTAGGSPARARHK